MRIDCSGLCSDFKVQVVSYLYSMSEKNSYTWCLVGGAAGLIGSATLAAFKDQGARSFGVDLKEGSDYKADLTKEDEVSGVFDKTFDSDFENFVLVNCQAIADPYNTSIERMEVEEWNRYMEANLLSSFLMCREFVKRVKKLGGKSASIINLSSTRHLMMEPNNEAYAAAKGAIVSFTKALGISLSNTGIRVNSLSPGWIAGDPCELTPQDHKQHPVGRAGKAADIAKLCLYLASEDSGFVTGQDIVIDGGMTVKMIYE